MFPDLPETMSSVLETARLWLVRREPPTPR